MNLGSVRRFRALALAAGAIVLCDRFTDSTEAYQGSGRHLGSDAVRELHRVLCGDLQPDLTLLMDSNPRASVNRARRRNQRVSKSSSRGHDENRFEQETRLIPSFPMGHLSKGLKIVPQDFVAVVPQASLRVFENKVAVFSIPAGLVAFEARLRADAGPDLIGKEVVNDRGAAGAAIGLFFVGKTCGDQSDRSA